MVKASTTLAQDKKSDDILVDLEPKTFSEIIACFIETSVAEKFPEYKKIMWSRWSECNALGRKSNDDQQDSSNMDSDDEDLEETENDMFTSQIEKHERGKEDNIDIILNDISSLTAMDQWILGNAEKDVFERLINLCKKTEVK